MNIKEYQKFTPTTALYPKEMEDYYLSTGLAAEAGEVAGVYAKYFRGDYTRQVLIQKVKKELGDNMWFISQICKSLDLSIEELLDSNVEKLTSRKDRGVLKGDGDDR